MKLERESRQRFEGRDNTGTWDLGFLTWHSESIYEKRDIPLNIMHVTNKAHNT